MAESKVSKKLFQKITGYSSSMISRYQKNEKQTLFNFCKEGESLFFLVDDTEIKNILITKNNFTSENNKINIDSPENTEILEKMEDFSEKIIQNFNKIEKKIELLETQNQIKKTGQNEIFFGVLEKTENINNNQLLEQIKNLKIENQKLRNENWTLDSKLQKIFYQKKLKQEKRIITKIKKIIQKVKNRYI